MPPLPANLNPPPSTSSATVAPPQPAVAAPAPVSSRPRAQATRRKANVAADDAAYHGSSSAGVKRGATDKAEGEPRGKRKRADNGPAGSSATAGPASGAGTRRNIDSGLRPGEQEGRTTLIDFTTFSTPALHRYLTQFNLIPDLDPSPATAGDPPPPSHLLRPRNERHSASHSPPPLPITPANRPRRDASAGSNRRRNSRILEEDDLHTPVIPVLADVAEFHGVLATIAERHFRDHVVKEVDTLTAFICALKAKGTS